MRLLVSHQKIIYIFHQLFWGKFVIDLFQWAYGQGQMFKMKWLYTCISQRKKNTQKHNTDAFFFKS